MPRTTSDSGCAHTHRTGRGDMGVGERAHVTWRGRPPTPSTHLCVCTTKCGSRVPLKVANVLWAHLQRLGRRKQEPLRDSRQGRAHFWHRHRIVGTAREAEFGLEDEAERSGMKMGGLMSLANIALERVEEKKKQEARFTRAEMRFTRSPPASHTRPDPTRALDTARRPSSSRNPRARSSTISATSRPKSCAKNATSAISHHIAL